MEFLSVPDLKSRKKAAILVLPFLKSASKAMPAASFSHFRSYFDPTIATGDFTGKEGEVCICYAHNEQEPRLAFLGLGDTGKISTEILRRAYSSLTKACGKKKIESLNIVLPHLSDYLSEEEVLQGVCEGILLTNYRFEKLKQDSIKENPSVLLKKVTFIGADKSELTEANRYLDIAEGVYLARDLVNDNADQVTPQFLAKVAKGLEKTLPHTKTMIHDKKWIEKEKMGLLLAVSRGACHDPAFIIIEYKGNPKSKDLTVLVGKGVTFDTGGLNLKATGGIETMKCDMGGAAAVLGTIFALGSMKAKVNVTAVIPATENAISSTSYKPGDVYISYLGKTVEISNTDAEGRLILADAMAYAAKKLKPSRMIDIATLTGAMDIILSNEASGVMSNNDDLSASLVRSGQNTFERLWRLPLFEEYRDALKSDIADMRNAGTRSGSSITAAMFLKEFVEEVPWAHIDIASTAYISDHKRYHPKFATGFGVRLLTDFILQNYEK